MTTAQEYNAALNRIDASTSTIAQHLREIAGSMTSEEEATAKGRLIGLADTLDVMARDVSNPVPIPVPEPGV